MFFDNEGLDTDTDKMCKVRSAPALPWTERDLRVQLKQLLQRAEELEMRALKRQNKALKRQAKVFKREAEALKRTTKALQRHRTTKALVRAKTTADEEVDAEAPEGPGAAAGNVKQNRTVLLLFSIRIFEKSILHWHTQKAVVEAKVRFPK